MIYHIYKATNEINNKSYIGYSKNLRQRITKHKCDSQPNKSVLQFHNAIRKHGVEAFDWEVLTECPNLKEAKIVERCLIKAFDTFENGYNMTEGGDGSEGLKRKPFSEAHKQKLSEAKKGKTAWNKGIPNSEEHNANISEAMKGKSPTAESNRKRSKSMKDNWARRKTTN